MAERRFGRDRWRVLAFLCGVLAVHFAAVLFHLLLCTSSPAGAALQEFYHSGNGRKETWPLIDYYGPLILLSAVTFATLHRTRIWVFVVGLLLAYGSVAATTPVYATRMVPRPTRAWGAVRAEPFTPMPHETVPAVPLLVIAMIIARTSALAKEKEEAEHGG